MFIIHSKSFDPNVLCTILDLCNQKPATVFEGDILVVYGPAYTKTISPSKIEILHADLVDRNGQMTITLNISNNLIQTFAQKIVAGLSLRITDFACKNKSKYERGDANCCIVATVKTSIQNIPCVCKARRLTPDMTIQDIVDSPATYFVGSFGAIITGAHRNNEQLNLYVKDTDKDTGITTVQLSTLHLSSYQTIQSDLAAGTMPLFLFKNFYRQGPKGQRTLRTSLSSFIEPLNDDPTKSYLESLLNLNTEVTGLLKPKDIYSCPFHAVCMTCKHVTEPDLAQEDNISHCGMCNRKTTYHFTHMLQCTIYKNEGSLDCMLHLPLLAIVFPELTAITHEQYEEDISTTVFLLRKFHINATFTLNFDNNISSIRQL